MYLLVPAENFYGYIWQIDTKIPKPTWSFQCNHIDLKENILILYQLSLMSFLFYIT